MMCCSACPLNPFMYSCDYLPDMAKSPYSKHFFCQNPKCKYFTNKNRQKKPNDCKCLDGNTEKVITSEAYDIQTIESFTDLVEIMQGNKFCGDCSHRQELQFCRQDSYVLANISKNDEFALMSAHHTLDTLVFCNLTDELVDLFQHAPAEERVSLWDRLTAFYPNSLHLLNGLYEQAGLPPLQKGEWPKLFDAYRAVAEGRSLYPYLSRIKNFKGICTPKELPKNCFSEQTILSKEPLAIAKVSISNLYVNLNK